MKKNNTNTYRGSTATVEKFHEEVSKLISEGYVAMPMNESLGKKSNAPQWSDTVNTFLEPTKDVNGDIVPGQVFSSSSVEIGVSGIGTENLGYMSWGPNNNLPNRVALLSSLLPYTATGNRFNTDVAAGLGPRAKYRYTITVNDTLTPKEVDYNDAGELIKSKIYAKQKELLDFYASCKERGITLKRQMSDYETVSNKELEHYKKVEETLIEEIDRLNKDYEVWEKTSEEIKAFIEESSLQNVCMNLFTSMTLFDICYPEIRLSQGRNGENGATWKPKVTSIGFYDSVICRLERMDDNNKINYVYVSNRFYDTAVKDVNDQLDIKAVPALDPVRPLASLREKIRDSRLNAYFGKKRNGRPVTENKPTRFILPSYYPAAGRPYYPQPAWWSIFGGSIYQYAANIISDRVQAKENSNMWGKVIYVHTEYLGQLYHQMNINDETKRAEIRNQLWNSVNTFLKDRNQNGSTLLSFSFTGSDGKEHDAFRIVDIPATSKSEADAQKTELQEISSIIFFSMQINPALIGSVPGSSSSSGGTYQRELYLLKQLNMKPTQQIVLSVFDVVSRFNEWDKHLVWRIQENTLTTLDRSATGLTESQSA